MHDNVDANIEIEVIRNEIERATENILSAATTGLSLSTVAKSGNLSVMDDVERVFYAIIEACTFQDITGQRLSRLKSCSVNINFLEDELLHGPATSNGGMTQEDADSFFSSINESK
jgi:hypothetical protein